MPHLLLRRAGVFALPAVAVCISAGQAQPVIRTTEEVARTTVSNSIRVKGVASSDSPIVKVYWVDTLGRRGTVEGIAAARVLNWAANVPLQPGANRIGIIAVDSRNRAATAPFFVMRNVASPAGPTQLKAGKWRGRPVSYAVVNG